MGDIRTSARVNVHTFQHICSLPLVHRPKCVLITRDYKDVLIDKASPRRLTAYLYQLTRDVIHSIKKSLQRFWDWDIWDFAESTSTKKDVKFFKSPRVRPGYL